MSSSHLKHGCAVGNLLLLKASRGFSARGRQGYCVPFKNQICALSRDFISFNAQFFFVCVCAYWFCTFSGQFRPNSEMKYMSNMVVESEGKDAMGERTHLLGEHPFHRVLWNFLLRK